VKGLLVLINKEPDKRPFSYSPFDTLKSKFLFSKLNSHSYLSTVYIVIIGLSMLEEIVKGF